MRPASGIGRGSVTLGLAVDPPGDLPGQLGDAAAARNPEDQVCGTVTSGGTESILMAMKAYRDWARREKGITTPEIIMPHTAHPAFDKAGQYFGIKMVRIPVDRNYRADIRDAANAITRRTVVVVGSAPSFPHGMVDPIAELAEMARRRGVGFHTDACLGGFVLPWAETLGYDVPPFDFRLPGVTSISVDTHKYGYAAKGTSVVLYRTPALRRYQYFTIADWPGGLYCSPTFAGSRPGALSAACWAAMVSIGQNGYRDATRRILETAARIKAGIREIPDLYVLGDPLWVIAMASRRLDIYRIMDVMGRKGWSLNGLHRPSCVHLCVTLRHTQPGAAARFLTDLRTRAQAADGTLVILEVCGFNDWLLERLRREEQDSAAPFGELPEPVGGVEQALPAVLVGDRLERDLDAPLQRMLLGGRGLNPGHKNE